MAEVDEETPMPPVTAPTPQAKTPRPQEGDADAAGTDQWRVAALLAGEMATKFLLVRMLGGLAATGAPGGS